MWIVNVVIRVPDSIGFPMRVSSWGKLVDKCTCMKPALQCVGMNQPEFFVKNDSPTPFFCQLFLPVLSTHLLLTKITLLVVKIDAIQRQNLSIKLGFNLLNEIVNGIAVKKTALLPSMCVQIAIVKQPALFMEIFRDLLNRIATRLFFNIRSGVIPV